MQGTWTGSPLVSLEGAIGSSHVLRLLLVPHPHFPENVGDTAGSTSCQREGGFCSLGKGWILLSHLLEMSGSKEKPGVWGEESCHGARRSVFALEKNSHACILGTPAEWLPLGDHHMRGEEVALISLVQAPQVLLLSKFHFPPLWPLYEQPFWGEALAMERAWALGLNPAPTLLCDLRQVTQPQPASVSSCAKWGYFHVTEGLLWGGKWDQKAPGTLETSINVHRFVLTCFP